MANEIEGFAAVGDADDVELGVIEQRATKRAEIGVAFDHKNAFRVQG